MYNDTPLGTNLHFKELDRQVAQKLSSLRPTDQKSSRGTTLKSILRRVRAVVTGTRSTRGHEQTVPRLSST